MFQHSAANSLLAYACFMRIFKTTLPKRKYFLEEPKQTIENSGHVPQRQGFSTQSVSLKCLQTSYKVRTTINFNSLATQRWFQSVSNGRKFSKVKYFLPAEELEKCFLWNNLFPYLKTIFRSLDQPDLVHAAMCSKTGVDSLEEKDSQVSLNEVVNTTVRTRHFSSCDLNYTSTL